MNIPTIAVNKHLESWIWFPVCFWATKEWKYLLTLWRTQYPLTKWLKTIIQTISELNQSWDLIGCCVDKLKRWSFLEGATSQRILNAPLWMDSSSNNTSRHKICEVMKKFYFLVSWNLELSHLEATYLWVATHK